MRKTATREVPALVILVLGLLLTACTSPPVGAPVPVTELTHQNCPVAPIPPEYRLPSATALPGPVQFTLDLALDEWREWGRQIIDYREVDWKRTQAVRQHIQAGYVSEAEFPGTLPVVPVVASLGCWENDQRLYSRLRAYWRPLQRHSDESDMVRSARRRYAGDLIDSSLAMTVNRPASWSEAWSAAFLSFIVSASAERHPEAGSFTYSENHTGYATAAVEAVRSAANHRYVARSALTFVPRPGDMVCSYRNQARHEPWQPDQADWRLGSGHCDLVIAVDQRSREGRLFVVGGNVFQSVSVSIHATDVEGRLVESQFRNWAIVLADRANPAGL